MKVRELLELLSFEYPDLEVVGWTDTHRIVQILSVNKEKSSETNAFVLNVDWTVTPGKVVESEVDKLEREKQNIINKINKLKDEEKAKLTRALSKKGSNRTPEQDRAYKALLALSGRANGGRGRPRKKGKEVNLPTEEEVKKAKAND